MYGKGGEGEKRWETEMKRACRVRPWVLKSRVGAGRWVQQVYPTIYLSHR